MKIALIIMTMILALTGNSSVLLSHKNQGYILSGMAQEQQKLFRERLEKLVKLTIDQRWKEVYELISIRSRAGRDTDQFVTEKTTVGQGDYILIDFTPKSAEQIDRSIWGSEVWIISGCGRYQKRGKILDLEAMIEVSHESNQWYFSEIALKTQVDSVPHKCRHRP